MSSSQRLPSGYVRPAKLHDLPQLATVLTSSFYPLQGWQRWFYPLLHFSICEDIKQRLQTMPKHYRCLAAIAHTPSSKAEVVAGTVEIACKRYNLWDFHQPKQIYLSNLAVQAQYRRQGLACQLLEASEQQALNWGFREIYLHVMVDNHQARQLYQKMGYRVQRVEDTMLSLFNLQPQRLLLKKILSPQSNPNLIHPLFPQVLPG